MASPTDPDVKKILPDTRVETVHSVEDGSAGRGCLLQLYPVSASSELIRLRKASVRLGRDVECDIVVDDSSVSRVHAVINALPDGYILTDLDSTNGTWIADTPVTESRQLNGGELIRIGNTILKFMMALDEEAQYHAVVHDLMTRDSLTNAWNRGYLVSLIRRQLEMCRDTRSRLSLIMIDLDRFKRINDRYGHLVGDEVLRVFCERTRGCLRKTDILGRFGGDEFIIVCPATSLTDGVALAEKICETVAGSRFQTHAGQIKITCSLGAVSTDGQSLPDFDALVSAADTLLYRAKAQGRNGVHCSDGPPVTQSTDAD